MSTSPQDEAAKRPDLGFRASLFAFEYPADDQPIRACMECLPWYVEVVVNDDGVTVREWHAFDCPVLRDEDEEDVP